MSGNYRRNKAEIERFRKELHAELGEISEIDTKILTQAVNEGLAVIKDNTPVDTGFLRRSWKTTPTVKLPGGVRKEVENSADYAIYVNYGHRVVGIGKKTVGFVKGKFFLERGVSFIEKRLAALFRREVQRIDRKYH